MVVAALGIAKPIHAHDVAPYVEVTGGVMKMSIEECIKLAREVANETGFTERQEEAMDRENKIANFYAWKEFPYSLNVNCNASVGVYSIGVGAKDKEGAALYIAPFILKFP